LRGARGWGWPLLNSVQGLKSFFEKSNSEKRRVIRGVSGPGGVLRRGKLAITCNKLSKK
jgi:hypothetical protein